MATIEQKIESDQPAMKKQSAPRFCSVDLTASGPITNHELSRISELGLGRGVDATDPSPWSRKSSFQVRYVTSDGIITTNEGGALQTYEREISSITTVQTSLKASISAPTQAPIDLHLEGEYSRSISSTRKAIGKQVMNRTISFKADFNDIPEDAPKDSHDTSTGCIIRDLYSRENSTLPVYIARFTFEQRLAEWIMDRVVQRRESELDSGHTQTDDDVHAAQLLKIKCVEPTKDLAHFLKTASKEGRESIFDDCISFIRHFRITHYVSAIQLGASQYRVLSENEYYNKISTEGAFGYEAVVKLLSSSAYTKKITFKASDTRQVGKIIDDKVKRDSDDEAVVGIKIQPIHSLVKLRYLHLALQQALQVYVEEQRDTTSGPYVIACGAKSNIFWKVNSDEEIYNIGATTDLNQASLFYILPDDDGKHIHEFRIGWKISNSREKLIKRTKSILHPDTVSDLEPLCRYLDANVNVIGRNPGPLQFKSGVDNSHCRLTLHSRLIGRSRSKTPIDIKVWASGKEEFFICCARRRLKVDGYIAIKRTLARREREAEERYTTACVPKQACHNERDTWMLFRLLPAEFILSRHQDIKEEKEEQKSGEEVPARQEMGGAASVLKTSTSTSKREHVEMKELHTMQC